MSSFIWGFPDESAADLDATLARADRLLQATERTAINLFQLAPLSGTYFSTAHRSAAFDPDDASAFVYPEHLPALRESPAVVALIRQYPEIFSAFYRVDTPDFAWKRQRVERFVADWYPVAREHADTAEVTP